MSAKNLIFGSSISGPLLSQLGLGALRVITGLSIAFGHGLAKLPPSSQFVKAVAALGFPLPEFFAWAAGMSEFVGGLLLAAGLMTRPAAAAVAFTLGVAAFGHHASDPFKARELALLYCAISLLFACAGSGRFGLDRIVNRL
ncbi:MAG: DoxX family protein [Deltaproteobacteria bacterium]|nr:DoxX family protein [Deltaproteobacteria bacterium]MBW2387688.1 DoxX family protein [Deltaproteobacteria bacterium]MBW2722894.1 DoxX family protein [Deltaproteobacteria bacterium]